MKRQTSGIFLISK